MQTPTMKSAKGNGIAIQLAIWEGQGQTIFCLHGITANSRCWDHLASVLAPEHRVIAMDLRGRGGSDKPATGYSEHYHVKDIQAVLDDLQLDKVILMGHSLGAFLALAFAATYPNRVSKLILVDGGGALTSQQLDKTLEGIRPSLDRLGKAFPSVEAYLDVMRQSPHMQPWRNECETYYRYELEELPDGKVQCNIRPANVMEEAQNVRNIPVADYYDKLQSKVLILRATQGLVGKDDLLLPASAVNTMLKNIPDAKCLDLKGANHFSIVFQPSPLRDQALLDFIDN